MTLETIARVCHEVNRAYCQALGDNSQQPWATAPDHAKQSARLGVQFRLAHPEADPRAQHEAWCADKRAAGWVHGPVKDEAAKTHPCLVPYDELPVEQRAKDYLFCAVVDALAPPFPIVPGTDPAGVQW